MQLEGELVCALCHIQFYSSQKKRRKFSAKRKKNILDNTGSELVSEYWTDSAHSHGDL